MGEKVMLSLKLRHRFLAALAGAMVLAATTAQAAMLPAPAAEYSTPDIQLAWCAVGAHIGPLGACIGGPGYYGHRGYGHRHCWINRWGHRVCN
jgi:hypothetical protein